MAHPITSASLRDTSVPSLAAFIERSILRYVSSRAERARDLVFQYDALAERMTRTLQRRRIPAHPTLGWFVEAQVAIGRATEELNAHSDRMLADIQVPRELVKAIAILSAYGWPRQEAVPSINPAAPAVPSINQAVESVAQAAPGMLATLRRRFFPRDSELEEAYLADATDLNDLEYRMRQWDRRLVRDDRVNHFTA